MTALFLLASMQQPAPDCSRLFANGLQEYSRKEFNQALIAFRAAAECNPQMAQAYLAMADVHAQRGNEGEALAALLEALRIEPRNELALRAAVTLYLKNGLHLKALPLLETLVTVAPEAADAHAELAAVYATGGDREGAEREFRRALELQPNSFAALAGLGNLLARAGKDDEAVRLLRQAVQAQPQAWQGRFLLGSALNRRRQFEEAKNELEQSAKLGGGNDPQLFYQLARAWGGIGNAAERRAALARFSELTKLEKENTDRQRQAAALINEARELLQKDDLEAAAQRLESARELRPGDPALLFRLAGLHYDLRRYDAAREYAQAAISVSPSTWLYHYLLGLVERSTNRLQEARSSLQTATTLQASEAPVFNALGEVLLQLRDRKAAVEAFEKAVKLAPDDSAFRRNLEAAKQ